MSLLMTFSWQSYGYIVPGMSLIRTSPEGERPGPLKNEQDSQNRWIQKSRMLSGHAALTSTDMNFDAHVSTDAGPPTAMVSIDG